MVHRLSPTGLLLGCTVVSIVGLAWLSFAESTPMAFVSASVFAVGICYFWPTMLGFVSERIPRSGALGLGLMGAVGMAVVGLVTTPQMGRVADQAGHGRIPVDETVALFTEVVSTYPTLAEAAPAETGLDLRNAAEAAARVLDRYASAGALPPVTTANALRAVTDGGEASTSDRAAAILGPADNYGGRVSFRAILPFTAVLVLVFGLLYTSDRRAGGYRARKIVEEATA